MGAFFRAIFENQQKAKHVESIWIPCLDWGSIPHYSTIKQKEAKKPLFCLSSKFRHYATKKGYGNSDQCYICNIIGLFSKRFYAKNIQENFMFFNGLHKANTHLQHNRNYVVNTLKISYRQSKRFVIKDG